MRCAASGQAVWRRGHTHNASSGESGPAQSPRLATRLACSKASHTLVGRFIHLASFMKLHNTTVECPKGVTAVGFPEPQLTPDSHTLPSSTPHAPPLFQTPCHTLTAPPPSRSVYKAVTVTHDLEGCRDRRGPGEGGGGAGAPKDNTRRCSPSLSHPSPFRTGQSASE